MAIYNLSVNNSRYISSSAPFYNLETTAEFKITAYNKLLLAPGKAPENVAYKKINALKIFICVKESQRPTLIAYLYEKQKIESVTWNDIEVVASAITVNPSYDFPTWVAINLKLTTLKETLNFVGIGASSYESICYTEKIENVSFRPYIQVDYDENNNAYVEITGANYTEGFINEKEASIFQINFKQKELTLEKLYSVESALYWKETTKQTWAKIIGNGNEITVPANTFTNANIEWYAEIKDIAGAVWTSPIYSVTTVDSAAVGAPILPSNTVEDGSGPITFTWKHANNTGTEQSAADLEWSSDGATWNDLATINGSGKSYTAPANTFPAGTVYWRVRTYNSDDVAGEWSAPITFVSVAAPPAPVVAADSKPYTTITWQSSGQLAYNIAVDGVEYGPRFGTDKSITLKERLENGLHRATVKVQGMYGLWSEAGAVDFQISNMPGTEIKLKVILDHAPRLSWSTEGTYSAFQIYRNGKLVGKTTGTSFVDNLAIGNCSYQLVGIMADGNYTESNIVKGAVCLPCTMICDLERGEWQKLELSAKSYPEKNFSESQNHSNRHFCGAALPVLELSQHRNKSGSYEAAFKCRKDAEAFEKLMGKVVCIKSKPDDMIIGGLLDWQKLQGEFYAAYSFTVSAIYWEDYRDETDS